MIIDNNKIEEVLKNIRLANPHELKMVSNGHGEFPDIYQLTENAVRKIIKQLTTDLATTK